MFEEKPGEKHYKDFGSFFYVHVPVSQGSKLDAIARKYVFIDYDERKKEWNYMDLVNDKFVFLEMLSLMRHLLISFLKVLTSMI